MKKSLFVLMGVFLAIGSVFFVQQITGQQTGEVRAGGGDKLFEFERMIGVSGAFLGPAMPLRGVPGGGAPWVIAEGNAELDDDGELKVEVEGLILGPAIGPPFAGTNPVPLFFATVSCLDAATGAVVNIDTATVPANNAGDAEIEETISLPPTCVAPIVLVRGELSSIPGNPFGNPPGPDPSDPWFAVSGF